MSVDDWGVDEVCAWLSDTVGLGQYHENFAENDIEGVVLDMLDHETLKDIGVSSVGHRMRILKAAKKLGEVQSLPVAAPVVEATPTPTPTLTPTPVPISEPEPATAPSQTTTPASPTADGGDTTATVATVAIPPPTTAAAASATTTTTTAAAAAAAATAAAAASTTTTEDAPPQVESSQPVLPKKAAKPVKRTGTAKRRPPPPPPADSSEYFTAVEEEGADGVSLVSIADDGDDGDDCSEVSSEALASDDGPVSVGDDSVASRDGCDHQGSSSHGSDGGRHSLYADSGDGSGSHGHSARAAHRYRSYQSSMAEPRTSAELAVDGLYVAWINSVLTEEGDAPAVGDLGDVDGVILIELLEACSGEELGVDYETDPATEQDRMLNLAMALWFLERLAVIALGELQAEDIYDCDAGAMSSLLASIAASYPGAGDTQLLDAIAAGGSFSLSAASPDDAGDHVSGGSDTDSGFGDKVRPSSLTPPRGRTDTSNSERPVAPARGDLRQSCSSSSSAASSDMPSSVSREESGGATKAVGGSGGKAATKDTMVSYGDGEWEDTLGTEAYVKDTLLRGCSPSDVLEQFRGVFFRDASLDVDGVFSAFLDELEADVA